MLAEGGRTAWSSFFDLAPGDERTLTYVYELPMSVITTNPKGVNRYSLAVRKQPGTEAVPIEIEVLLPEGSELVETPEAAEVSTSGLEVRIATNLRTDREFLILYRTEGVKP